METIGKIRRRHHVGGESISAIARSLNLSRNTVKKYLNAQTEPTYRRSVQPKPQLGPFSALIEQWLALDANLPKARRRTEHTPSTPFSTCLRIASIWLSENIDFVMQNLTYSPEPPQSLGDDVSV